MSWIPDNTILEQLKCFTCRNYIFYGPVTQTPDGYNCGRCSADGNEISTFFEIFAKNCLFPCRYAVSGCNAKVAYGEEVINHEKVCEFRLTPCPVVDCCVCEWNGPAITSYEHCLNEHKECIVVENNGFEFNVNLRESVNRKSMMKRKNGEMLLLHLLYSEEIGLSLNIKAFIVKNQKRFLRYTLVLQSSDKKNQMQLENREITSCCFKPSLEWIAFNALCCLDKTTVLVTIEVDQNAAVSECDNCYQALPLYILKCAKNHQFCRTCRDVEQQCTVCKMSLRIASNYIAMVTEGAVLGCCNAIYGCTFSSDLAKLQKHEENCTFCYCVIENCEWKGCEASFWKHLTTQTHFATPTKVECREEDVEYKTYLPWITGSCKIPSHSHERALFIVQTMVDYVENTVKIVANYIVASPGTIFTKGHIKVTVGEHITYDANIGRMIGVKIDRSCEIHVCRSLLKQEQLLTIELVNCEIDCI